MTDETRQPDPTDPAAASPDVTPPPDAGAEAPEATAPPEDRHTAGAAADYPPYKPPTDTPALDAGDENPDALVGRITSSDVDLSHLAVVEDTDGGDSDA